MLTLSYDHSFEGFLTAVFHLYAEFGYGKKIMAARIAKDCVNNVDMFDVPRLICTDGGKADRVLVKLEALLKPQGVRELLYVFMSEQPELEHCLLQVIDYALRRPDVWVLSDFTHPGVIQSAKFVKSVNRERHRMTALVRFQKLKDGLFFAIIAPDFNVLPLIAKHFKDRYQDQRWAIFDEKRGFGIYYDLNQLHSVDAIQPDVLTGDEECYDDGEKHYQQLWRAYFNEIAIKERRNLKLHVQNLPIRYWKYLTEKQLVV